EIRIFVIAVTATEKVCRYDSSHLDIVSALQTRSHNAPPHFDPVLRHRPDLHCASQLRGEQYIGAGRHRHIDLPPARGLPGLLERHFTHAAHAADTLLTS